MSEVLCDFSDLRKRHDDEQEAPAPKTDKLLTAQIVASAIFLIGAVGKVTDPTAPDILNAWGWKYHGRC